MLDYQKRFISDVTDWGPPCSAVNRLCVREVVLSVVTSQPAIAVVIATCDRGNLLAERALPAVVRQSYIPDYLVVVDDSQPENRPRNQQIVASATTGKVRATYRENSRTKGASGSWNTALAFLHANAQDPSNLFVAVLDDDDSWAPDYLQRCFEQVCERNLDMVAADIHRLETTPEDALLTTAPDRLCAADFLTSNPGIQGSNLFVRLSVLLRAGGFDEELRSTTDRDLCIRIADLGTVKYGRLAVPLVQHFADDDRKRLSIRGAEAKLSGLTSFWKKYAGRMTMPQHQAFNERAWRLFGWQPELVQTRPDSIETTKSPPIDKTPTHAPFILYVGVISGEAAMISSLLRDLGELNSLPAIAEVVPVVLENGNSRNRVSRVVEKLRRDGLKIGFISEEQQRRDAARGSFGDCYSFRPPGQVGIAQARTTLQRYLGGLLRRDDAAFGWILDDDMRVGERARTYLRWLPIFREQGVDALIGHYEWASPNPPLNGVRGQLVDLYHNLAWLQTLDSTLPLPDRSSENQDFREKYPDYYYDLSRKHTGHLETPYWLEPAFDGESVRQAYDRLLSRALSILSGAPVTRPLVAEMPADPVAEAKDSVNRGGTTFFLNHRPLTAIPNSILRIDGREARRSDMIWAVVNRYYRGMTIKKVGMPVHHRGRFSKTPTMNRKKVVGEIVGSAFYGSLTEFLKNHPDHGLNFSANEYEQICTLFEEHLRHRLNVLELNFYRIRGLTSSIRGIARHSELEELFVHLERWFTPERFAAIREGSLKLPQHELKTFLSSLRQRADDYASGSICIGFLQEQLQGRSEPITDGQLR